MTTGPDLDSYTLCFMARPWHETFLHILRFLHFADNSQRPDQGEEYDRLWKLRTVFDTLDDNYAKLYNPSENLTMDEVIVKYSGRVIFRHYIPKKRKCFGIKIYKSAWLEDQVRQQQILCGLTAVITNTGQRNPWNSAAAFVHLGARERPRFTSAPSVM